MKFRDYEKAGVRELWLVDTESLSVIVHRGDSDAHDFTTSLELGVGELLSTPLLEGLVVDNATLFGRQRSGPLGSSRYGWLGQAM